MKDSNWRTSAFTSLGLHFTFARDVTVLLILQLIWEMISCDSFKTFLPIGSDQKIINCRNWLKNKTLLNKEKKNCWVFGRINDSCLILNHLQVYDYEDQRNFKRDVKCLKVNIHLNALSSENICGNEQFPEVTNLPGHLNMVALVEILILISNIYP